MTELQPRRRVNYVPANEDSTEASISAQRAAAALQVYQAAPIDLVHTEAVYVAQGGADEKTNATDRARGFLLRLAPLSVLLAILAAGIVWVADVGWGQGIVLFAVVSIGGYYLLTKLDYSHSRAGLERHRIDKATDLAKTKMGHDARLRREALRAYTGLLERRDDD